jgi:hypothetical protein
MRHLDVWPLGKTCICLAASIARSGRVEAHGSAGYFLGVALWQSRFLSICMEAGVRNVSGLKDYCLRSLVAHLLCRLRFIVPVVRRCYRVAELNMNGL